MANLALATDFVLPDEKAWNLKELNLPGPGSTVPHRYQIIKVKRGDAVADYQFDLGLATTFKAWELHIPSLWEHTVAELQAMADEARFQDLRKDKTDWPATDLLGAYRSIKERKK